MSRGTRWSTEYLDAMIAAWEKSGLTSEQFTATAAPGLPARTLRLHRQRKEKEIHAELQRLRDENATLRSMLERSALVPDGCRAATVSDSSGHGIGDRHVANGTEAPSPTATGPPASEPVQPRVVPQDQVAGPAPGDHDGRVLVGENTEPVPPKRPAFSWD
ncbi:hypothetical protein [Myxococcus sp. RHSTA-1-4]|uniref:hypothetical protein n=1 Tax=Myxococcus sp. RHSTA-1-4 TaxID=2874601 RepID=UPI001CC0D598|nr:hypothetical protein [Myxococcus sp. RHSTA-1-4]MBZ4423038.1 hypothetical protein [Myxococcus sp. RHSTA-1-4]